MKILLFHSGPLGDSFFTGSLSEIVKKEIPEAEVYFYTSDLAREMLLDNPFIDGFLIETGNIFRDIFLLRKNRFDFIIDTLATGRSFIRVALADGRKKISFFKKKKDNYKKLLIYTELVPYTDYGYVFWDRLKLLSALGIDYSNYVEKTLPNFYISEEIKRKVIPFLEKEGLIDYVVVAPKGKWQTKSIPKDIVAELVDVIQMDFGKRVVLAASFNDKSYIEDINRLAKTSPVLFASKSIREFAALIDFSKHLISVESLPYHIAIGLRKSATVVLGAYPVWKPRGYEKLDVVSLDLKCQPCSNRECKMNGSIECLRSLSPEKIIEVASKFF